ncbi:MAG: hypothetical protein ACFFEF_10770 [Candidatus Thorarchaeota archaeon]
MSRSRRKRREPSVTTEPEAREIGNYFFYPVEGIWPYLAVVLAIILFAVWTFRSSLELFTMVALVISYACLGLVTTRFKMRKISLNGTSNKYNFRFVRSGVSWKTLVSAILGGAIPILLAWFILTVSVSGSDTPSQFIMLIAMICYIILVPILPALASVSRLGILKTTLHATVDKNTNEFDELILVVNPLDEYWYENRNEPELIASLKKIIHDFIKRYNEDGSSNLS